MKVMPTIPSMGTSSRMFEVIGSGLLPDMPLPKTEPPNPVYAPPPIGKLN